MKSALDDVWSEAEKPRKMEVMHENSETEETLLHAQVHQANIVFNPDLYIAPEARSPTSPMITFSTEKAVPDHAKFRVIQL